MLIKVIDETEKAETTKEKPEAEKSNVIKQLFVTASPKLCASITEYYKKLHTAIKPVSVI